MSLKLSVKLSSPDFSLEDSYSGPACGLDEVGRGPLAGPVVAACVYIPNEVRSLDFVTMIQDSKRLNSKKLEYLHGKISEHFIFGVAEISPQEIDEINILQASLKAMEKSFFLALHCSHQHKKGILIEQALVDGNRIPKNMSCPARAIIKGDSKSVSIAAASIIAKVTRDRIMTELAVKYPYYGWDRNAGYPSPEHLAAINRHGISPHHRRSYTPVRNFLEYGVTKPECVIAL